MMTRAFLRLLALTVFLFPSLALADSIVGMRDPNRDYVIEGDVVTVWDDSFLLNDGSGQVIVDVRPYTTYNLGLAGRDYVQVVGRANHDGIFKPLVMSRANANAVMFQGQAMLPPLPLNEVMKNTVRYRLPRREAAQAEMRQRETPDLAAAGNAANGAPGSAASGADGSSAATPTNSGYTSTGASPAQAVQPVGAASAGK